MVDRLEVDDDYRRHAPHDLADVVRRHHDRLAVDEARSAAVDDRDLRAVPLDRFLDLGAPDGVADDVDVPDDEAADRTQRLRDCAGAVLTSGTPDPQAAND